MPSRSRYRLFVILTLCDSPYIYRVGSRVSFTTAFRFNHCFTLSYLLSFRFLLMAVWMEGLVISVGAGHLQQAEEPVRREFVENYRRLVFPALGTSTGQTMWKTYRKVTRVTLWGHEHFRNNIRLFIVMEALGLGPDYYCVERTTCRMLSSRVFLLTRFLPFEKICFDTWYGLPLMGPFDMSVRARQVGDAITQHRIPPNELPNFCPACHSQFCDHAMESLSEV